MNLPSFPETQARIFFAAHARPDIGVEGCDIKSVVTASAILVSAKLSETILD
jgi:hypothetical protein